MPKRRFVIALFVIMVSLFLLAPISSAKLTSSVNAEKTVVTVGGVRVSQTAWGQGPDNYMAGVTSKERLPGSGQLEFTIAGTGANGAIGSGTGYKAVAQFWNDAQNYIALGVIHDPGPSPSGITVMVEGAADNQPVGGYWGAGMPALSEGRINVRISWTPTQISWVIANYEEHRMTFGINMSNPSFSMLGGARMPGDSVSVNFEIAGWQFDQAYNIDYSEITWDEETICDEYGFHPPEWVESYDAIDADGRGVSFTAEKDIRVNSLEVKSSLAGKGGKFSIAILVNDTVIDTWQHLVSHTDFQSYTHTASVTEFDLSPGDTIQYLIVYDGDETEGDETGGIDSIDVKLCGAG